jgi:DNA-binding response OmpR family regulator
MSLPDLLFHIVSPFAESPKLTGSNTRNVAPLLGASYFITKPYSLKDICQQIECVLNRIPDQMQETGVAKLNKKEMRLQAQASGAR